MAIEARHLAGVLARAETPVFEYYPNLKRLRCYVRDRLDQSISLADAINGGVAIPEDDVPPELATVA